MSPLDRIHQLTNEKAILRTQLRDAQEQAKRDSDTIARQRGTIDTLCLHGNLLRADLADLTATWDRLCKAL